MRRLNQISRTYSFESTKISISFGACKMRRLNQALIFDMAELLLWIPVRKKLRYRNVKFSFPAKPTFFIELQMAI